MRADMVAQAPLPRPVDASSLRRRLVLLVVAMVALLSLAIAWTWTPLRAWLDVDLIVTALRDFGQSFGPLAAIVGFAAALTVAIPLSFLTLVALVAFGPWAGMGCAFAGGLIGAAVSYGLGRGLGREVIERMAGPRINLLSHRLASRGVLAVIVVRLVPLAPFAVINMVAGASHIRLRDLLLGTAIGMAPSTLAMAFFVDQIAAAMRQPTPLTFALLLLTVVLIVVGAWALRRWLHKVQ
jgi:uncharacterized membrane protein YdjX (TVP38/TMEM64 family)